MGGIFLIGDEDNLTEMTERSYSSEEQLQNLIAKYPNILPGKQIDSFRPRRWILVSREMGLPDEEAGSQRWSVDHLFLDQYGIPTLVEVKRTSNTQIRREVVGQMLDYAANAVLHLPLEAIQQKFKSNHQDMESDLVLEDFLTTEGSEEEPDLEDFWQQVKTNLRTGKVRLIFVADKIPQSLEQIVAFLNSQMKRTEVLAVEVQQFVSESGLKTLVPRLLGQTVEAQQRRSRGSGESIRSWGETSWYKHFEAIQGKELTDVVRKLSKWSKEKFYQVHSSQRIDSRATLWTRLKHSDQSWRMFGIRADGKVELQFSDYKRRPPFGSRELRKELRKHLNEIPGVHISGGDSALEGRPTFNIEILKNQDLFVRFCQVFDWAYIQIANYYSEESQ